MGIKNFFKVFKKIFRIGRSQNKISGKIKFFDRKKGFGFIISGKYEYFFHAASTRPRDHKALQDGAMVKFTLVEGKKGLQAHNIEVI